MRCRMEDPLQSSKPSTELFRTSSHISQDMSYGVEVAAADLLAKCKCRGIEDYTTHHCIAWAYCQCLTCPGCLQAAACYSHCSKEEPPADRSATSWDMTPQEDLLLSLINKRMMLCLTFSRCSQAAALYNRCSKKVPAQC